MNESWNQKSDILLIKKIMSELFVSSLQFNNNVFQKAEKSPFVNIILCFCVVLNRSFFTFVLCAI
ncbi:MAG: hypothetical protein EBU01_03655 [Crocinitomicaceae bacterium]|nr:hypothetical protein [Crocinitomicaceae bacterium]